MGLFDSIERKLEGVVNDGFARAFASAVQPVEITARLQRELDAHARSLGGGRSLVPNQFRVQLSPHDHDQLAGHAAELDAEIVPQLRAYALDSGYVFNAPVALEYRRDETLPTGRFTVRSRAAAAPPAAPDTVMLEVHGVQYPLQAPGLTIGRGADVDVRVDDPGLSRRHARITVGDPHSDHPLWIEDLGSTNGVRVNGQRVQRAPLAAGSRIELGATRLLVRRGN